MPPHGLLHQQQVGALAAVEEEVYGREAGGDQLTGRGRARGRSRILAPGLGGECLGPQLALVQCGACTGAASSPHTQTVCAPFLQMKYLVVSVGSLASPPV